MTPQYYKATQLEYGLNIRVPGAAADFCITECCPGCIDRPGEERYHSSA